MRLGLIGLGRIGAFHAATLTELEAVESLVVYDAAPGLVDTVVKRQGAEPAVSAEALLAAGIDGVVIAAATAVHPELILASLAAGLPTFCEKPVSKSPDDSAEILRATRASGVPVQIGYPRRFDAAFAEARRAVAAGELGFLHTVRSTTLDPAPPPDEYVRTSGGIFRDCSVHDFDAVRFVTGQEVVEVYATGSNQGAAVFAENDDVDTAASILTLDSGTLAVVSNSRYNAFPDGRPHHFFLYRFADAFRRELTAFTDVVAGKIASPCTVADAVEVGWIAEAATLSLHEHRPIRMDEIRTRERAA
jgi:myo-inositol 2-dehydrogenase / D-chiro-inositol 1-dehydrogenase